MATPTTLPADKFDTNTVFVRPDGAANRAMLSNMAVLPGFNTRVKDADYAERVSTIADSIVANGFFDDKPFAVTMLPNDDTIYVYDGEHRFDAAKQAVLDGAEFPDGLPIAWAKDGATVKDLTIHLAHGNNGERLNMVELAAVVRRMQGLSMSKDEISTALGRTTRHVDNLFVLAAASSAVKKAVASGQIAGAEAVKLLRKDPKTAGAKIAEAVKVAAEKGKAKATPKTMTVEAPAAPKGPKMKTHQFSVNMPEGETMGAVLKAMASDIRAVAKIGDGDKLVETGMIRFSVTVIDHEAEAAAVEAAAAKAAAQVKRDAERAAAAEVSAKAKAVRMALRDEAAKKKEAEKRALAKAAAKAGKAAAKGKTAEKAKTPRVRKMAREAAPTPATDQTQPEGAESAPATAQTQPAADAAHDSMGGL